MKRGVSSEKRQRLKTEWSRFVLAVLRDMRWTASDLASHLGCSKSCVARWICDDPVRGTIPTSLAAKRLVELARERKLVD